MDDLILEELRFSVNNHKYKIEYNDESLITKKQKCQDKKNDPEIDSDDKNSNISDPEITSEVISSIGKGAQRSIKDILKFIVLDLVKKEILNSQ
ncbi:20421_t:CDS:2 [Gigaspora margarita]|uniref:20421_t:CDS:1 n=1 Tax=Gigaspora margarita TaxID=4874 RepID=A0ABN7VP65_GIGMA|nr:20421_t:CDS:2 [Gigaspora margarita]